MAQRIGSRYEERMRTLLDTDTTTPQELLNIINQRVGEFNDIINMQFYLGSFMNISPKYVPDSIISVALDTLDEWRESDFSYLGKYTNEREKPSIDLIPTIFYLMLFVKLNPEYYPWTSKRQLISKLIMNSSEIDYIFRERVIENGANLRYLSMSPIDLVALINTPELRKYLHDLSKLANK